MRRVWCKAALCVIVILYEICGLYHHCNSNQRVNGWRGDRRRLFKLQPWVIIIIIDVGVCAYAGRGCACALTFCDKSGTQTWARRRTRSGCVGSGYAVGRTSCRTGYTCRRRPPSTVLVAWRRPARPGSVETTTAPLAAQPATASTTATPAGRCLVSADGDRTAGHPVVAVTTGWIWVPRLPTPVALALLIIIQMDMFMGVD